MALNMRKRLRRRSDERGQAIVLAALVALVAALAVFLTFAIGHRTREKIKLQAMADSAAYSQAVAEARAFNYYAWSNRAIIGHYVSILSIHAHQSYITWYEQLLEDVSRNYTGNPMQILLRAACICSKLPCSKLTPCGCICKPCSTACQAPRKARQIGNMFRDQSPGGARWLHQQWHQNKRWDRMLHGAAQGHYGVVSALRAQQMGVHARLAMLLNGGMANGLAGVVDNRMRSAASAGLVNTRYLNDAVITDTVRADDYHEILSGTRYPDFITRRGFRPGGYWGMMMARAVQIAMPDVTYTNVSNAGNAKVLRIHPSSPSALSSAIHRGGHTAEGFGAASLGAGAEDHGRATSYYIPMACPCIGVGSKSQNRIGVWTDPKPRHNDGTHWFHNGRAERESDPLHDLGSCTSRECGIYQGYMRYRVVQEGTDALWNQPRTYAVMTKRMDQRQPWDFDFTATLPGPVSFTTTRSRGDGQANGAMAAMAAGLVYYHKPNGFGDNWREPPNLWNPFWRAKLNPVTSADARQALAGHPASMRAVMSLPGSALNY